MADRDRGERALDDLDDEAFDEDVVETDEAGSDSRAAPARSRALTRARAKRGDERGRGFLGRRVHFIREVVAELQKVIWPTRKELVTYATVVVVFVSAIMGFVALLDVGFARAMIVIFGGGTE